MQFFSVTEVLNLYFNPKGKIPQSRIEDGIARGNPVHHFCTETAKQEWVPKPLLYEGYCNSFLWWLDNCVEEIILVEERLEDVVYGYFGHPDLLVKIKGNRFPSIIDLKTPATKSKLWRAQIAGYDHLALVNGYFPNLDIGGSLRLQPDGRPPRFDAYEFKEMDFAAFVSLLNWTRWLNG